MIAQKWCKEGQHYVDLSNFHKFKQGKLGLQAKCKDCVRKYRAEYYAKQKGDAQKYSRDYYAKNVEKVKNYQKEYAEKNQEKVFQRSKSYRSQNREILLQRKREDYLNNTQRYKERAREYELKNPQYNRISTARRRARLKEAVGQFTPQQWLDKIEFHKNCCYLCRKSLDGKKIHLEHRIPISKGGTNWIANIAPACAECNLKKGNKTEKQFRLNITDK